MTHHLEGSAREALRRLVVRLRDEGLFEREIARVLALRRATVQVLMKEAKDEEATRPVRRSGSGG